MEKNNNNNMKSCSIFWLRDTNTKKVVCTQNQ